MGPFNPNLKKDEIKIHGRDSVITMKNDKFEEELACHFKVEMRNLTNFDPCTRKSQKFSF